MRKLAMAAVVGGVALLALPGCIVVAEDRGGTIYVERSGSRHVHVHSDGCGHYYWHGAWYSRPHPHDCGRCAPRVHVHGAGYHWHGAWRAERHPANCHCH